MNLRTMGALAACVAMAPPVHADEQTGLLRRMSCPVIRFTIAKYSVPLGQWARSKGATDANIEAARRCLSPEARTATT